MRKLHGVIASPFVRKVRIALAEKGLEFDVEPVMPMGPNEEYRKISPLGKIPCLEEDGWFLPDSSVIIQYLEETNPDPALYPKDARLRAEARFLEEYADTALVAACGTIFFQRLVGPRFMNQPTDEAAVTKAIEEDLPPLLAYLETRAPDSGDAIIGDSFGIADLSIASPLVNARFAGENVDAGRYPKLAAYFDAIVGRKAVAALIEEEQAMFAA